MKTIWEFLQTKTLNSFVHEKISYAHEKKKYIQKFLQFWNSSITSYCIPILGSIAMCFAEIMDMKPND